MKSILTKFFILVPKHNMSEFNEANKIEIAEITEKIAEMSVEILGKVEELGSENGPPQVCVAGSYDEALTMGCAW